MSFGHPIKVGKTKLSEEEILEKGMCRAMDNNSGLIRAAQARFSNWPKHDYSLLIDNIELQMLLLSVFLVYLQGYQFIPCIRCLPT